jgi:hypothetical protein
MTSFPYQKNQVTSLPHAIFKMAVLLYKKKIHLYMTLNTRIKIQDTSYKNPVKSKSNASAIFWAKSEPAIFSRRSRQHKNESLSMARMRIIIRVKPGMPEQGGGGGGTPPRFWSQIRDQMCLETHFQYEFLFMGCREKKIQTAISMLLLRPVFYVYRG